LSTNTTISSGVPQTLSAGSVPSGTNALVSDRPSYSGVGNGYVANPSPSRWYDPASFVLAPEGSFGTVGRNAMTTPHLQQIDAALAKNFRLPKANALGQGQSQRFQTPVGAPNGKHPGRHSRGTGERGASGLRRHHASGPPDAPDSAGLKYSF
jgi:hypothetical protein